MCVRMCVRVFVCAIVHMCVFVCAIVRMCMSSTCGLKSADVFVNMYVVTCMWKLKFTNFKPCLAQQVRHSSTVVQVEVRDERHIYFGDVDVFIAIQVG